MDAISESRLAQVHPVLAAHAVQLLDRFDADNTPLRVTQGLRSWQQQEAIWLEGRDAQGNIVDPTKVVTNAPPGSSWHEYGLAFDVVPMIEVNGNPLILTPDWNTEHSIWQHIIAVGESLGMYSGSHFGEHSPHPRPDDPHFQEVGRFHVSPDDEVRSIYNQGGIPAVWAASGLS